jgi:hypothetical protein
MTVTFDGNILKRITKIDENRFTQTEIDLKNTTIKENNNDAVPLDMSHFYTFTDMEKTISRTISSTDYVFFMNKLLSLGYFEEILTFNNTERYNKSILDIFYTFSYLVIPIQEIDNQLYLHPTRRVELLDLFFRKNSKILYYFKKLLRYILLIPGLILSPIIIIIALLALNRMG